MGVLFLFLTTKKHPILITCSLSDTSIPHQKKQKAVLPCGNSMAPAGRSRFRLVKNRTWAKRAAISIPPPAKSTDQRLSSVSQFNPTRGFPSFQPYPEAELKQGIKSPASFHAKCTAHPVDP